MRSIWKYRIHEDCRSQVVELPRGSRFLHAGLSPTGPAIWAEVDTDQPNRDYIVHVVGTGHERPRASHLATYLNGPSVWHVYVERD